MTLLVENWAAMKAAMKAAMTAAMKAAKIIWSNVPLRHTSPATPAYSVPAHTYPEHAHSYRAHKPVHGISAREPRSSTRFHAVRSFRSWAAVHGAESAWLYLHGQIEINEYVQRTAQGCSGWLLGSSLTEEGSYLGLVLFVLL